MKKMQRKYKSSREMGFFFEEQWGGMEIVRVQN